MRVLVTGGAGFIGSHVVDRLLAAGHEPVIFDVRPSPYPEHDGVQTRLGDLLDAARVLEAAQGCDAIAHLAAAADVGLVAKDPCGSEALNVRGTLHVLEAARATGARVLYASTIWAYSDVQAAAVDEDTGLALPSHLYTATKVAGEMYCRSYGELYGVASTILRFGIPYGPRARPAAVLPIFVNKALAGEPLTIAGDGAQSRRFVFVEDLADGVVRSLRPVAAGRVYNLVGAHDTTVRQIADAVRDAVGDVEITHTEGRSADFAGASVSGDRAREELGWEAQTPFAEGVRRYVEWHRRDAQQQLASPRATGARWFRPLVPFGALMAAAILVVLAYMAAVESAGLTDAQTRTVGLVAVLILLAVPAAVGSIARGAWALAAVSAIALSFRPVARAVHVAALDPTLALLGVAGAALLLMILDGGRRVARIPAPEQA